MLASIVPPVPSYHPHLPNPLVTGGVLSDAQLESITYAGDGTGCGKGRRVAGIVMDNWIKGRRKAVWISKSDKLKEDAIRDRTALGGGANEIIPQSRYKLGRRISAYEGVLFTTPRGSGRDGKASRLDQ